MDDLVSGAPRPLNSRLNRPEHWTPKTPPDPIAITRIAVASSDCRSWTYVMHALGRTWPSLSGLRAVELGAGAGFASLMLAAIGCDITLVDFNVEALRHARHLFAATLSREVDLIAADLLALPASLSGRFDIALSYGTVEHFLGRERETVVGAHYAMLKPGGLAIISVPNAHAPIYRTMMAIRRRLGFWPEDLPEVPFSKSELYTLARGVGFTDVEVIGNLGPIEDFRQMVIRYLKMFIRRMAGLSTVPQPRPEPVNPGDWEAVRHNLLALPQRKRPRENPFSTGLLCFAIR